MPGKVALKVKRNVLKDLSKNTKVIVVTGTNGKTTSCRILEEGLKKAGKSYFINKSGANLITGVTASFIMNSTVTGKCKKDYAIIECDENAFKEVSRLMFSVTSLTVMVKLRIHLTLLKNRLKICLMQLFALMPIAR